MNNLAWKTILGFVQLIIVFALLLFVPVWTIDFWQAWIYSAVFIASAALIATYLWRNYPRLLERRLTEADSYPCVHRIQ
jgi:hypothetical protein